MGQIQSFEEFLGLLRRQFWLIALIAIVGTVMAAVFAKSRPDVYESTAVLQIELPQVADPAANVATAQLLQAIEHRLTTREALLAMIERHGLFADAPAMTETDKITALRTAVRFQNVASVANQTFGAPILISAILITAQLDTADHAARVANDFAQGILDRGSESQLATSRATYDFFVGQEKPVWAEITALEQEIALYKNANAAALPTRRDAQSDELVSLETERRAQEQTIVGLKSERAAIEATGAPRATERRAIADLTARIDVLNQQKSALDARRTEVETALSAIPDVERVLNTFDRRLRQLQDRSTVITTRMAEAETALQLAEGQQTERFSMLERAITPDYPVSSGAKQLAMAGGVVSILVALGVAFMLDLLNPVVRTAAQMQRQLGIVPVVSIPELSARTLKSRTRLATAALALTDGRKPMLGLPGYAMIVAGATLFLMVAAAAIA